MSRAYATSPAQEGRPALAAYAKVHQDPNAALALLAMAAKDVRQNRTAEALRLLAEARPRLPLLVNYIDWLAAEASHAAHDFPAAAKFCAAILDRADKPPFLGAAVVLAARSAIASSQPARAIEWLRKYSDDAPQPESGALLASAYEAAQDLPNAAAAQLQVWLRYPLSGEAQAAEAALARYRAALGTAFKEPSPEARLERATRLLRGGRALAARKELDALASQTTGTLNELARVRSGEALRRLRRDRAPVDYLQSLTLSAPEADAERLLNLVWAGRRAGRQEVAEAALERLRTQHAGSEWRLEALAAATWDYYLLDQFQKFEPLFRECYTAFQKSPRAAGCHWKVAFAAYRLDRADAATLLRAHASLFPASEYSSAALYYLGRIAERASSFSEARAYYDRVGEWFPNHYYGSLARARQAEPDVAKAKPGGSAAEYLRSLRIAPAVLPAALDPPPGNRFVERSRLLRLAGLDDAADKELAGAAKAGVRPEPLGYEMALAASARQAPHRGIQALKRYAGSYLFTPIDRAPREFWVLAFPLPWKDALFQSAKDAGVSPYLVAAIARQESEFDPAAISVARAFGLTQILPSTGRDLARRLGLRRFTAAMLFQPEVNLRLGSRYVRSLNDHYSGRLELTLAAYNAGSARVSEWLKTGTYREPAEFIESIPFPETRNYVQAVLRNADFYERLYNSK